MTLLTLAIGATCGLGIANRRTDHRNPRRTGPPDRSHPLDGRPAGDVIRDMTTLQSMGDDLLSARIFFSSHLTIMMANAYPSPIAIQTLIWLLHSLPQMFQRYSGSHRTIALLGRYIEVLQPVLSSDASGVRSRLVGYVSVGMSPTLEQMQISSEIIS